MKVQLLFYQQVQGTTYPALRALTCDWSINSFIMVVYINLQGDYEWNLASETSFSNWTEIAAYAELDNWNTSVFSPEGNEVSLFCVSERLISVHNLINFTERHDS